MLQTKTFGSFGVALGAVEEVGEAEPGGAVGATVAFALELVGGTVGLVVFASVMLGEIVGLAVTFIVTFGLIVMFSSVGEAVGKAVIVAGSIQHGPFESPATRGQLASGINPASPLACSSPHVTMPSLNPATVEFGLITVKFELPHISQKNGADVGLGVGDSVMTSAPQRMVKSVRIGRIGASLVSKTRPGQSCRVYVYRESAAPGAVILSNSSSISALRSSIEAYPKTSVALGQRTRRRKPTLVGAGEALGVGDGVIIASAKHSDAPSDPPTHSSSPSNTRNPGVEQTLETSPGAM